jgi:hypothetical protein
MKVYAVFNAIPWEHFSVSVPNPNTDEISRVHAASNATHAGFLPLFWSKEDAEKAFPDYPVQEAEVSDDWNPWFNEHGAVTSNA